MALILAVAPYEEWAREHSPLLAVLFCVLLALLIVRIVVKTMTRLILLALVTALGLFVFVEKDNIQECTQSCSCTLAGFDIDMPACDPHTA